MIQDTFTTIAQPVKDILIKDKGSKFIGFAFPVQDQNDIKNALSELKEIHPQATHHCYAWQLGFDKNIQYRVNDDGEPGNTAGNPIHGQILSFKVTNILIVVVRYYGGTKLGVRGLINAYKLSAKETLESVQIITTVAKSSILISFGYDLMNKVQRIIKQHQLEIISQKLEATCSYTIAIRNSELDAISNQFKNVHGLTVTMD